MRNEKGKIQCDYCGATRVVYTASNGKHFCDQTYKAFFEAKPETHPPPYQVELPLSLKSGDETKVLGISEYLERNP